METEREINPRKHNIGKKAFVELNPEAIMKEQQKKYIINTAKPNESCILYWLNVRVK